MKPILRQLVAEQTDAWRKRNVAREYLQVRILQALQDSGAFSNWALLGGTALRLLYALPRYSEDLDFSTRDSSDHARFEERIPRVCNDLTRETYTVDFTTRSSAAVHSAFVRFPGLPYELGFSPHREQVLSIRVEIDTNPPAGAGVATRVVRRYILLHVLHHDKASLFAGKLHAILARPYTKGRDLYDLVWYLSDSTWPGPNLAQLNNALAQTGWNGPSITEANWREVVAERLDRVDWDKAVKDVSPFLERSRDLELLSHSVVISLLK